MNIDNELKSESARKNAYLNLSACFLLPNTNLQPIVIDLEKQLDYLRSEAYFDSCLLKKEIQSIDDPEKLKIDFSRLFVGPYSLLAPPYGSIYLEGEKKIMGTSTMDACSMYSELGLDISSGYKDAPDHITVELEFMFFLIFKEIKAIVDGDAHMAMIYLSHEKAFLQRHLGSWVDAFTHQVEKNANTEFYKKLASVTRKFVAEDLSELSKLEFPELVSLTEASSESIPKNTDVFASLTG